LPFYTPNSASQEVTLKSGLTCQFRNTDADWNAVLENHPFLRPCVEIKKANLYEVFTGAILGRVSNAAAVNVRRSTNGLLGDVAV
jgi:hypothetical protein